MTPQDFQVLFAVLALAAAGGSIVALVARLAAPRVDAARRAFDAVSPALFPLAWLVAAVATAGSLYFSEVANYEPCRLCWFQRIAMYPIAVVLLIALIRRDLAARWYAIPMAVVGAGVSIYHYYIEWNPEAESGCSAFNPCSLVWFRRFGFVSLPFMALCGFVSVVVLLTLARSVGVRRAEQGRSVAGDG